MMTIPMDNLSTPPSRELVQRLYNKNIELENKRRKSAQARIPSDPNAWQQMRENYETIILEDHDFSELHEIEYALWQLHYRRIEEFRAHFSAALASVGSTTSQGGKGPARPDRIKKIRSQFKTFLSESTGFYHDLILKIRAKYGLPLGYFSEDPGNQIILEKDGKKSDEMKRGLLSCHRCLIYLGDLARYKGLYGEGDNKTRDYAAASSYYMQAVLLWPSSGNPHHQLAILASYAGDDVVAIYRYFRSLAVDSPFSTARDNLIIAFEKNRQSYSQLLDDAKASVVRTVPVRATGKGRKKGEAMLLSKDIKAEATSTKERTLSIPETYRAFCIRFIRLNGILFTRTSLETFGEVFSLVSRDLHELLSSGIEEELNFGSDAAENSLFIVRIISILVFTAHNVNREMEGQSYAEILQRSVLLQNAFTAAFEFVGHILERCIQLHDPSSSYLLPGILVFIEWLACHPDIAVGIDVEEKQATARSFFWNHCIAFLNKIMSSGPPMSLDDEDEACFFNMTRYDEGETGNRLAFWEDFELRGFLPLVPAQLILDFSRKHSTGSGGVNKEKRARVQRILAAGKVLANVVRIDQQGMYFDQKLKKFAIGVEPQMSEDLLNGTIHDNPVEISRISGVMQPNMSLSMGEEEEDEVIVFKPTVAEKPVDMVGPKLTTYENVSRDDWTNYVGSFASPLSNLRPENALDASIPLNLQPTNPSASKWLMGEQASITNGMKNLGIVANGLVMNAELDEGLVASQFPALSSPFQQSGWAKDSDVMIPSKFDTIMSSKANGGSLTLRPPAASPANLKKNPVSRPVRHHGPPPGFSPVPPKPVDESIGHSDDYSWLDGYQLSSSTKDAVSNSSMNHTAHVYPHVINNNNTFSNVISFPFPGKQVPTMEVVHIQNQESWQDNQMLEHLKLYQEQQQQLQQANVQFPQGEQYQAQSLWSGRFFV